MGARVSVVMPAYDEVDGLGVVVRIPGQPAEGSSGPVEVCTRFPWPVVVAGDPRR